jgi:hypothetical protein
MTPLKPPVKVSTQSVKQPIASSNPELTQPEAAQILSSPYCECGHGKNYGHAFCGDWYKLPSGLKTDLFRRIGWGFENAYLEAQSLLKPKARGARA